MPPANANTRRGAWNQRTADAVIGELSTQQLFRITQLKGKTDQGGNRCQRNVTLGKVEPDTDDLLSVINTFAYHADVRQRSCIRTRTRAGQRKTGNFLTACQTWQVVILLFFGAVVLQQLTGSE